MQGLRALGWVEGRTVTIEYRWAEGQSQRYAEIAAEFARLKVDVIVIGWKRGSGCHASDRDHSDRVRGGYRAG